MFKTKYLSLFFVAMLLIAACRPDSVIEDPIILIDTTPYVFEYGDLLPTPNIPEDNQLTIQTVKLGRMLFYETKLSKGEVHACAECHRQADGFSDSLRLSIGVEGLEGKRQAMPIFNLAWHTNEFFWDGRSHLLRDQALKPIQDELEMNETLENVIAKLGETTLYTEQFTRAFGSDEITSEKMALAMEQFMMTIVSFNSKYDKYLAGETTLTESEARGLALFEGEYNPFFPETSGADCAHCHGGLNFKNDEYMNNGLDTEANLLDIGREMVTENAADRGKFKVPSLRNIAKTAPYMHDGRFTSLEEVINHYNEGIQNSPTAEITVINTMATGLLLTDEDKVDLINFLKTLTDETYLNEAAYSSPF